RQRRRLVGFARVALAAGEEHLVEVACSLDHLRVREAGAWVTEPGHYHLDVGLQANDPDRVELVVEI
ncbi:MAG TPA: fibronectin type III-like domain-contianing protein, partial [Acidimicrobiales bacterium]